MQQQTRKGDRSRRDDDRYLFLEALIRAAAAVHQLHWPGDSGQYRAHPSVLVTELVDYLAQSFCLPGDEACEPDVSEQRVRAHLQRLHSRMPFAAENFQPGSHLQSFAAEWLPAATGSGVAQPGLSSRCRFSR